MNSQHPSARESCFPGLHPGYFSRIPNRLISALLQSQQKPWPDAAVWLYLYALVGFGSREFPVQTREGRRFFIELEPGEFICSLKKLSGLAGRDRRTLKKLIQAVAFEARCTDKGNWPVYQLKPELEPSAMQNLDMAEMPNILGNNAVIHNRSPQGTKYVPPNTQNRHRVEGTNISQKKAVIHNQNVPPSSQNRHPYKREYLEKRKERKSVDNSFLNGDHAAHDPKERRNGKAMKLGDCLPVRTEPRKPAVRKERALQTLAEVRDKILGDYLLTLMWRHGITREELDAACKQLSL